MHEIFVNYRTKGGKAVAYQCEQVLTARFGHDSVFLARLSIDPGTNYRDVLLQEARRSRVLLALIDEEWLDAPDRHRPGRRALANPQDWVRREIEEAMACGSVVVPVFVGRKVEQLDHRRLPPSIAELAECQYTRIQQPSLAADLARLGDRLVRHVPALAALDNSRKDETATAPEPDVSVRTDRQSGGIGSVGGSVGTFVNEAHGALHTGAGDQYNAPRITGDGTNHIAGDNHGGIRQGFGSHTPREGEDR